MEHWRAFGPEWFERHQRLLLWLLRAPLIGRWFRWCLCIRACDIGHARGIIEIRPHCYTVAGDEPDTLTTDFRTHWKYSKRMYYAFRPLWWAMHWWDALIAEPFIPQWSFGFPTLTAYPDPDPETSTVDGYTECEIVAGESWANLRTSAGTSSDDSATSGSLFYIWSHTDTDKWRALRRAVFLFDTSSLLDMSIVSGTLTLTGSNKFDGLSINPSLAITSSNPASNTALTGNDFSSLGSINFADVLAYGSFNVGGANVFVLNQDGLNAISDSVSKFGTRNSNYDMNASPPAWTTNTTSHMASYFADQTGLTDDPKLEVTYSLRNKIVPPNRMRPRPFAPGIAR